jgi:stearoyl-CoA desaturase (delta-9 desaturase)
MTTLQTVPETGPSPERVEESADRTDWVSAIPFLVVHVAPLAAFFVTVTWQDWVLCGVLYAVRMFCITAGYHRYFSHRTYKMNRTFQFLMAVAGTTAVQKGPLWWASHHRIHHRFTDLDGDVHSPRDGFWWSHVGWILSTRYKQTDLGNIADFAKYPELRLVERYQWVGPWALGVACFLIGGWGGLLVGFFLSTVLLWHGTFLVNSMAHIVGRRRYATPDTSRNSFIVAVITGGEGWHNNHHYLPASVRQGFRWWEYDPTWYTLRALAALHLVRDLKRPPARLLDQARVGDGAFDIGMFRSYWERAARLTGQRMVDMMTRSPATTELGPPAGTTVTESGPDDSAPEGKGATDLQRLIWGAMESANQLASTTRRTRHQDRQKDRVPASSGPGPNDASG